MINTINFELSKRLNELKFLDNIETENIYNQYKSHDGTIYTYLNEPKDMYEWCEPDYTSKTLTLEEAIEFLKKYIWPKITITFDRTSYYRIEYLQPFLKKTLYHYKSYDFYWDTLLEAIEKMIEYLLNNNLLTNK